MPGLLSVAIITLNEEANIARTLRSVEFADEVIVLDSGSTDRTLQIATSFPNVKVAIQPWKGFAAQKNDAIELCTGAWVLSLDADEKLSEELQAEIRALLPRNPDADAYLLRRRNLFLRRWIRHGGYYPDAKLRLFRRNAANFAPPARFSDRPVHETVAFDGKLETLNYDIIHHVYPTIETCLAQMDRYSTMGAKLLVERGEVSDSWASILWHVVLFPQLIFLWKFFFRFGFLDGREGFLIHTYHSTYLSWTHAKAWQTSRQR